MDTAAFWSLLDASAEHISVRADREEWLERQLAALPPAEIIQFALALNCLKAELYRWDLWSAATVIFASRCSDDGFEYFRSWLIGQGRAAVESVFADPDNLADHPAVQRLAGRPRRDWPSEQWPEWENLAYIAWNAYDVRTGAEDGYHAALKQAGHINQLPSPAGRRWSDSEVPRQLPRLTALFD